MTVGDIYLERHGGRRRASEREGPSFVVTDLRRANVRGHRLVAAGKAVCGEDVVCYRLAEAPWL